MVVVVVLVLVVIIILVIVIVVVIIINSKVMDIYQYIYYWKNREAEIVPVCSVSFQYAFV